MCVDSVVQRMRNVGPLEELRPSMYRGPAALLLFAGALLTAANPAVAQQPAKPQDPTQPPAGQPAPAPKPAPPAKPGQAPPKPAPAAPAKPAQPAPDKPAPPAAPPAKPGAAPKPGQPAPAEPPEEPAPAEPEEEEGEAELPPAPQPPTGTRPTAPPTARPLPIWPQPGADAAALEKQGTERPTGATDAKRDSDQIYAEDWWSHARPIFEIHGYYRLRAELFHNFYHGDRQNGRFDGLQMGLRRELQDLDQTCRRDTNTSLDLDPLTFSPLDLRSRPSRVRCRPLADALVVLGQVQEVSGIPVGFFIDLQFRMDLQQVGIGQGRVQKLLIGNTRCRCLPGRSQLPCGQGSEERIGQRQVESRSAAHKKGAARRREDIADRTLDLTVMAQPGRADFQAGHPEQLGEILPRPLPRGCVLAPPRFPRFAHSRAVVRWVGRWAAGPPTRAPLPPFRLFVRHPRLRLRKRFRYAADRDRPGGAVAGKQSAPAASRDGSQTRPPG